jgi:hypothetical protein
MPETVFRFFAVSAVLICLALPVSAQDHRDHPAGPVMSATEYSAFLQRFDDVATRWTGYFQKIDAGKIQVSYSRNGRWYQFPHLGLGRIDRMINEQVLLSALIAAFERIKTLDSAQSILVNEVAALRETVKELSDSRFAPCFEKHQLAEMAKGVVAESRAAELNDVSIELVRQHLLS